MEFWSSDFLLGSGTFSSSFDGFRCRYRAVALFFLLVTVAGARPKSVSIPAKVVCLSFAQIVHELSTDPETAAGNSKEFCTEESESVTLEDVTAAAASTSEQTLAKANPNTVCKTSIKKAMSSKRWYPPAPGEIKEHGFSPFLTDRLQS